MTEIVIQRAGTQGVKGDTGSQGIQGPKGDTGDRGIQGLSGVKGDTGERGLQGIQGPIGNTGAQGIQGVKGDTGLKGDTGNQGIQGVKGDTGLQGIQGVKGDTGDQGIQGIQGPVGPSGAGTGDMVASIYDPTAKAADAFARANHSGTQLASTISNFSTAADARISAALGVTAQAYTAVLAATTASFTVALETKLSNIATAATANSTDAALRARASHTGTQLLATISDAGTAASKNTGVAAGNVPLLDGSGLLDTSILPAIAVTDVFTVASQAAMLALTAQKGDIAIRSDLNKSFALATNSPTTLADWKELLTPTDVVLAVAGLTGSISAAALKTALAIAAADITDATANGRSLIQSANYAAMRTLLSLAPGINVQAYSAVLAGVTASYTTAEAAKLAAVGTMANRALTISSAAPAGGVDGDTWFKI